MAYAFLSQQYIDGSNGEIARFIERSIVEVDIPEGVKLIGAHAFAYCGDLARVSIPEGVERVGASAFQSTQIKELILPISCETWEGYAVCNMTVVERIEFGDTKYLQVYACINNFKCIEYDFSRNTTIPTLADVNAFDGINANAKILVPLPLYHEWIASTNWSEYASYIVPAEKAPSAVTPDYVSEGLEYEFETSSYSVIGRGSCLDSVIVIPETFDDGVHGELPVRRITGVENNEEDGAFANDQTIEEIVLPESGVYIDWHAFIGSSLKSVRNYFGGDSFWNDGLALEYVSFIDGVGIANYDFWEVNRALTLDFSRHTAVPELTDTEYLAIHPDLKILVPLELYDEWIAATNWAEYAEYIVAAR